MKYALIIPDGCADEPQAVLGGRTPLEAARVPNMDAIARAGVVGRADNVPVSLPPGSDVGTMSLFGYDPLRFHTGRAPIEAAAQGIELGPGDWAIRCNLVTIQNDIMRSFTAGQIKSEVARELLALMQSAVGEKGPWRFYPGVSYRNLLIYRGEADHPPFDSTTQTVPPHDLTDQNVIASWPRGRGSELLNELMQESARRFVDAAPNHGRIAQGEVPATNIWLWGQGKAPALEPFQQRFGLSGAVITAVDLLRGLGSLLGWRIVNVPGATGYLDTDYKAKGEYAIRALADVDFVVVHVEATDEASHEGEAHEKVTALERIDADIVGPVHEFLKSQGEYRILVSPDHPTYLRTKTHSHGYVPFAMCGSGIAADAITTYSEPAAGASTLVLPGHDVMPRFVAT